MNDFLKPLCSRIGVPLLTLLIVAAFSATAKADALLPGATIPGPTVTTYFGGTVLANTGNVAIATASFSGFARSAVVRNSSGTLDFYYQVSVNPGGIDGPNRLTAFNFTDGSGFAVTGVFQILNGSAIGTAGFVNGNPLVLSTTADRSATGSTIGWNYPSLPGCPPPCFALGETNLTFVIRTTAVVFVPGNFNVIDGGVASIPAFAPTGGVPEPASMLLLGTGLAGIAGLARRRFRARG